MKKERHVGRKKYIQGKVQPGAHQNIYVQSDFRHEQKQDFLQFFGSTDARIKEENFVLTKNPAIGPGYYNTYAKSFKDAKRANTANFVGGGRKDLRTNDGRAPGEYQTHDTFQMKNWQTNIGAFGSTEKKFASINSSKENPGPG